jgi:SAM-dependent methyltransferase
MAMQFLDALLTMFRLALLFAFAIYLLLQVRRPSKWLGRPFVWLMNSSHSKLTDWGLEHTKIDQNFTILDVGCGGGRTIQKLAAQASNGKIYGVDYAEGSVAMSRKKNADSIQAGRVKIKRASVSQLPFADNKFDLATAIETQYYWPDLPNDMQEILRVLKPGGTLLIIAEVYRTGSHYSVLGPVMKLLGSSSLSPDDQRALFSQAGFQDVQIFEHKNGWICASGKKPEAAAMSASI